MTKRTPEPIKTFYVTRHSWAGGEGPEGALPDFGIVTLNPDEQEKEDEKLVWLPQEDFERLTGIKLEPGETKQVQLIEVEK